MSRKSISVDVTLLPQFNLSLIQAQAHANVPHYSKKQPTPRHQHCHEYNLMMAYALYNDDAHNENLSTFQRKYIKKMWKAARKWAKNPTDANYWPEAFGIELAKVPEMERFIYIVLGWLNDGTGTITTQKGLYIMRCCKLNLNGYDQQVIKVYISIDLFVEVLYNSAISNGYKMRVISAYYIALLSLKC